MRCGDGRRGTGGLGLNTADQSKGESIPQDGPKQGKTEGQCLFGLAALG